MTVLNLLCHDRRTSWYLRALRKKKTYIAACCQVQIIFFFVCACVFSFKVQFTFWYVLVGENVCSLNVHVYIFQIFFFLFVVIFLYLFASVVMSCIFRPLALWIHIGEFFFHLFMLEAFYRLTNFLRGIFISFLSSLHIVEMIMNGKYENAITLWQCFRWCTLDKNCMPSAYMLRLFSLLFLNFDL